MIFSENTSINEVHAKMVMISNSIIAIDKNMKFAKDTLDTFNYILITFNIVLLILLIIVVIKVFKKRKEV